MPDLVIAQNTDFVTVEGPALVVLALDNDSIAALVTSGDVGPAGPPGASGSGSGGGSAGFALDGVDGEDGMPIPGTPGAPGTAGAKGAAGLTGAAGFALDGDDGMDGMSIPGAPGAAGVQGLAGPAGMGIALDGMDGEDGMMILGARGVTGAAGPGGAPGASMMAMDGVDGEDAAPVALDLKNTLNAFQKAQLIIPVIVASASGTYTPDASFSNFQLTMTGNLTLANPTNLQAGQVFNFCLDEDATGTRTITLGSLYKWPGGTAPTWITTASAKNFFSGYYDGSVIRCGGGAGYA